jgi:hypothetical protein
MNVICVQKTNIEIAFDLLNESIIACGNNSE